MRNFLIFIYDKLHLSRNQFVETRDLLNVVEREGRKGSLLEKSPIGKCRKKKSDRPYKRLGGSFSRNIAHQAGYRVLIGKGKKKYVLECEGGGALRRGI